MNKSKMSWGATAYTPIISFNQPPFGFHERIQPSDYPTCPENPYSAAEELKSDVQTVFDTQYAQRGGGRENFIGKLMKETEFDMTFIVMLLVLSIVFYYMFAR